MKKIALLIPTLNELENVENLVREIKSNLNNVTIFIIDDSHDDKLGDLLNKKNIDVNYFHREKSSGRGSAIMFGLKKSLEIGGFDILAKVFS